MGFKETLRALVPVAVFLVLFSFILLLGCNPSEEKAHINGAAPVFFDLRKYFQKEILYLEKSQSVVKKTVGLNGKESILPSATVSYAEELAPFANSDINKPSWKDKYQVDSILADGRLEEIRYVAIDPSLKTRELRIGFKGGKVGSVWIRNSIHSIISESDQELAYERENGYSIKGRQAGRFADEKRFSVKVEF